MATTSALNPVPSQPAPDFQGEPHSWLSGPGQPSDSSRYPGIWVQYNQIPPPQALRHRWPQGNFGQLASVGGEDPQTSFGGASPRLASNHAGLVIIKYVPLFLQINLNIFYFSTFPLKCILCTMKCTNTKWSLTFVYTCVTTTRPKHIQLPSGFLHTCSQVIYPKGNLT